MSAGLVAGRSWSSGRKMPRNTLFCRSVSVFSVKYHQVGLLDIDICGPSVPHLMGVASSSIKQSPLGWIPVYPVTSISFSVTETP